MTSRPHIDQGTGRFLPAMEYPEDLDRLGTVTPTAARVAMGYKTLPELRAQENIEPSTRDPWWIRWAPVLSLFVLVAVICLLIGIAIAQVLRIH